MSDETEVEVPPETAEETPPDPGNEVELDDLTEQRDAQAAEALPDDDIESSAHGANELEAVFDVPVKVKAILGHTNMEVSELLKIGEGTVIELDRKVGEAIDIFVNNRLVARGEVVLVEDRLGVTMTEMIKLNRA